MPVWWSMSQGRSLEEAPALWAMMNRPSLGATVVQRAFRNMFSNHVVFQLPVFLTAALTVCYSHKQLPTTFMGIIFFLCPRGQIVHKWFLCPSSSPSELSPPSTAASKKSLSRTLIKANMWIWLYFFFYTSYITQTIQQCPWYVVTAIMMDSQLQQTKP